MKVFTAYTRGWFGEAKDSIVDKTCTTYNVGHGFTFYPVLRSSMNLPACMGMWCNAPLLDELINATSGDSTFISISVGGSILIDTVILLPYEYQSGMKDGLDIDVPLDCNLENR